MFYSKVCGGMFLMMREKCFIGLSQFMLVILDIINFYFIFDKILSS